MNLTFSSNIEHHATAIAVDICSIALEWLDNNSFRSYYTYSNDKSNVRHRRDYAELERHEISKHHVVTAAHLDSDGVFGVMLGSGHSEGGLDD